MGDVQAPRGWKREQVLQAIRQLPGELTLSQLEQASTGVSRDMVRRVLRAQTGKLVACRGRGPGAPWFPPSQKPGGAPSPKKR